MLARRPLEAAVIKRSPKGIEIIILNRMRKRMRAGRRASEPKYESSVCINSSSAITILCPVGIRSCERFERFRETADIQDSDPSSQSTLQIGGPLRRSAYFCPFKESLFCCLCRRSGLYIFFIQCYCIIYWVPFIFAISGYRNVLFSVRVYGHAYQTLSGFQRIPRLSADYRHSRAPRRQTFC